MTDYVSEMNYACEIMVAFSGKLDADGREITEAKVNGVPETQTAELFDTDAKRIIVCANKFQTGFDQPKLCAMYVDKMLTGVAAVRTLSRLNRTCSIPGKRTFVLDFSNDWETIRASFSNYYEATELDAATDPNVIYDLAARLEGYHIFLQTEVDAVAEAFYKEPDLDKVLPQVESKLAPGRDRWKNLGDEGAMREFKAIMQKFLRSYSFITQMVALGDAELHKLFVYSGFLIKKLFLERSPVPDLRDKVEMTHLRIKDMGTQAIKLEPELLHNGGANAGVKQEEEEELLSVLVEHLNEIFAAEWTEADKIMKAIADIICEDDDFVAQARCNSMGDLKAVFDAPLTRAIFAVASESQDIYAKMAENQQAFMDIMKNELLPIVYRRLNADEKE